MVFDFDIHNHDLVDPLWPGECVVGLIWELFFDDVCFALACGMRFPRVALFFLELDVDSTPTW